MGLAVAAASVGLGLLLWLCWRTRPGAASAALAQRLGALELALQHSQQASSRTEGSVQALAQQVQGLVHSLGHNQTAAADSLQQLVGAHMQRQLLEARSSRQELQQQFAQVQQALALQLQRLHQDQQHTAEQLRHTLNERLAAIQSDNAARLEAMRQTVDEQLHHTLEQRLGASFQLVSERLEQVHKGLGEMQSLAASVGDLKRVMTNVKSRGTWGEVQLGALLDDVLAPEQYARNVKTVPGSDELVEFAIRLPGRDAGQPVWLPIDAKYPLEHYQRLQEAHDSADKAGISAAAQALEASIRAEARKIASKYLAPPFTTDFALMYLPSEGLFAEVLRRPGLAEAVQNECRVVITAPANLAAMLNSLQMGFKTLAIEQRSSEVWAVLGQVKTEFTKFGDAVEATRKSIDAAAKRFEQVDVRTRAIQRKLRDVQALPAADTPASAAAGLAPPALSAESE